MFVVSSKSGGTVETRSHLEHFWALTGGAGAQFAAVTDPGSPLDELAAERGFDRVFHGDPEIGGRYSVLSPFGLVPAALAGAPVAELLRGAIEAASRSHDERANRGLWLGLALGELARHGRDKLTFVVVAADRLASACGPSSSWPRAPASRAAGSSRSPTSRSDRRTSTAPTACSCTSAATRPTTTRSPRWPRPGTRCSPSPAEGPADLGRLFFGAEFATAVAGAVLEINPFDQPNVQQAKDATNAALESGETEVEPGTSDELLALLDATSPPGYVSLHGYLAPSERRRRRRRRPARGDPPAHQGDDDVRLRAALPAFDRPAPQGRAARRRLRAVHARCRRRRRDPRQALHASARSSTRRRPAT